MAASDGLAREVLSDRALIYRRNTLVTATVASLLLAFPGFDTSELRILGMAVPAEMLWAALAISGAYNALLLASYARRDWRVWLRTALNGPGLKQQTYGFYASYFPELGMYFGREPRWYDFAEYTPDHRDGEWEFRRLRWSVHWLEKGSNIDEPPGSPIQFSMSREEYDDFRYKVLWFWFVDTGLLVFIALVFGVAGVGLLGLSL